MTDCDDDVSSVSSFDDDDDDDDDAKRQLEAMDDDVVDDEEDPSEKIAGLTYKLKRDLSLYDVHVELISLLRRTGRLAEARHARERFHSVYPLAPHLWLQWLNDETDVVLNIANNSEVNKEDVERINALFQRAVADYFSVDVWHAYIQFTMSVAKHNKNDTHVRDVCESALRNCGLDVANADALWDVYMTWEQSLLEEMEEAEAIGDSNGVADVAKQTEKVANIFRRRLSIPLKGMERVGTVILDSWVEAYGNDKYKVKQLNVGYDVATRALEIRSPFETKVSKFTTSSDAAVASEEALEAWTSYVDFEISQGDMSRVQCVFERALVPLCLYPQFWTRYISFVDCQLKASESISVALHERSLRNVPWDSTLWTSYIEQRECLLERAGLLHDDTASTAISALVNRACEAVDSSQYVCVMLKLLEFLNRRYVGALKEKKESALCSLHDSCIMALERITLLCPDGRGDPDGLLPRFKAYVELRLKGDVDAARATINSWVASHRCVDAFLHLADFEAAHGQRGKCVAVLKQALARATHYVDVSRVSMKLMYVARLECDSLVEINEIASRVAKSQAAASNRERERLEKEAAIEASRKQHQKDKSKEKARGKKRGAQDGEVRSHESKKRKIVEEESSAMEVEDSRQKKKHDHERHEHEASKDARTAFVSNLSVRITEDKLRAFFDSCGSIADVRVASARGKGTQQRVSRYAFIEFSDPNGAEACFKAIALNRQALDGFPVFVQQSRSSRATSSRPAYDDKRTVYVSNLADAVTNDALRTMFSPFGDIEGIRLIMSKSGQSRGVAYVQFASVEFAQNSLCLNGTIVGDKAMSVAMSDPEAGAKRRQERLEKQAETEAAAAEKHTKPRQRMTVPLIPRSMLNKVPAITTVPEKNVSKSNADFRSLLLGCKK